MLPRGLLKEYSRTLSMLIRVLDVSVIFFAGYASYYLKFQSLTIQPEYIVAISAGVVLAPIILSFSNLYSSIRGNGYVNHLMQLLRSVAVFALFLAGTAFFTKSGETYSRTWFAYWMLLAASLLIFYRCLLLMTLRFMRSHGLNEKRAVIFGAGVLGKRFAETVQQALWAGFRITAFVDDQATHKPSQVHGVPILQTPENLSEYLIKNNIDELWIALPLRADARVKSVLYSLRHNTITTRLVLDIYGLDLLNHSITDLAGFPVLNISATPMTGISRLAKAIEDRMLAFFILIFIAPVLLLIGIAVKCSSKGPILFKQKRLGWDERIINVYKFRTMYEHTEENDSVTQASHHDPRITPLGRFLRRTSLDELPQFINVLQGRMSIVGPRPHALQHNEQYKDAIHTYMQRHRVKPGITGWAQINGWRGETKTLDKMQKRVEYDLYYINNWSIWFDIKIILLTIIGGFTGKNAY